MEDQLIRMIEALWAGQRNSHVAVAGGDDCGELRVSDGAVDWLMTSDQLIQDRHFVRDRHPPRDLGRKALVRSLSDIAAMGGTPLCFLQTVCLPDWAARSAWHEEFQRGMRAAADDLDLPDLALLGGDVAAGDLFVATVTAIGQVATGTALLRSGARPGDQLCVSGSLGGSAQGLKLLLSESPPPLDHPAVRRHCAPSSRLPLGWSLRELPATAALDLSDGLAIDANRLADASRVALVIEASRVPVFPGSALADALVSGEEYELLFTCAAGCTGLSGLDVTPIGGVERGSGVWLETDQGRQRLVPRGYSHF
ncbi:MAG: thiamine-phosphate kinase [Bryobacterales bacterium]|nr:thiamine-phosphate kinase [Bryobacterales bacterium]